MSARLALLGAAALVAVAGSQTASGSARAGTAAAAPVVEHMVVFRNGAAKARRVSTRGVIVRVGRKRCAAATGTPLAALVRARPSRRGIGLKDYGSCSRRARDSGQLFVSRIGRDVNRGNNGWVYKVGRRLATAGAADPSGPFGRRRLRRGQRVTWFYCVSPDGECQPTLELRTRAEGGGRVSVRVLAYDDSGRGAAAAGAEVALGGLTAIAGADGLTSFSAAPGRYGVRATKPGHVRTYPQRVSVR
jgi:hypothetical protein